MDLGILSAQLEKLPASGLRLELKCPDIFSGCFGCSGFKGGLSYALILVYLLFFLLLFTALYCLPLLPLFSSFWVQFLCLALVLVWYCQQLLRKHILLNHPHSIKKLVFTELGWCYVQLKNSQIFKADINKDTILTEHLVILNLTERNLRDYSESTFFSRIRHFSFFNKHSVLLTAGRLDSKKFRDIKRHLRFISFSTKSQIKSMESKKSSMD